jgi:hypothetical protein
MGEYCEYIKFPVTLYASNHNSPGIGKISNKTDHLYEITSIIFTQGMQ